MKRNKSHTELRLIRFDLRVLCKMFTVVGVKGAFEIDDFLEVFGREIAKVLSEVWIRKFIYLTHDCLR